MDTNALLLDMKENDKTILLDILDRLVPAELEVWAFGSRARWTARETSDLDLVLRNPAQLETRLEAEILDDLKEAFEDSDLPFMVDLLDWATVSEKFRKVIEREYVVVRKVRGGEMLEGWKRIRLEDAIEFRNGKTPPERSETGSNPVFGGNGIIGYTEKSNSNGETIVVGRVGAYCGSLYYHSGNCWVTDNAIIAIAKSGSDSKFYYYLLKNIDLNNYRSGSSQPLVNQSALNQIEVKVPRAKSTQHRIAAILSSLDEKIELNRQANLTLEVIAQALFKEWFVDFNFPVATGEMQESELGPIPIGWKVDGIGSLSYVQNGYAFKSGDFKEEGSIGIIKIKNIGSNIVDIINTQYVDESVVKTLSEKFLVKPESLLIAMTGAEVGKIGLVPFADNCFWLNQRVGMLVERINYSNYYLYILLSSEIYQSTIRNSALGSAQPNISSSVIENIKAIIPDNETLISFGITAKPLIEKILYNISEIHQLSNIRDSLLPKLMNGEIEV